MTFLCCGVLSVTFCPVTFSPVVFCPHPDEGASATVTNEFKSFIEQQGNINETYKEMFEQSKSEREEQSNMLAKILAVLGDKSDEGIPSKSKKRKLSKAHIEKEDDLPHTEDDEVEIQVTDEDRIPDHQHEHENDHDDESLAWGYKPSSLLEGQESGGGDEISDGLEHTSGSLYQDILDQTKEVLGNPIGEELTATIQKTWG